MLCASPDFQTEFGVWIFCWNLTMHCTLYFCRKKINFSEKVSVNKNEYIFADGVSHNYMHPTQARLPGSSSLPHVIKFTCLWTHQRDRKDPRTHLVLRINNIPTSNLSIHIHPTTSTNLHPLTHPPPASRTTHPPIHRYTDTHRQISEASPLPHTSSWRSRTIQGPVQRRPLPSPHTHNKASPAFPLSNGSPAG